MNKMWSSEIVVADWTTHICLQKYSPSNSQYISVCIHIQSKEKHKDTYKNSDICKPKEISYFDS